VNYNTGSLLAQKTFLPRVNDSIVVDTSTKIIPMLRLQFDPALGNRFLQASAADLLTNEAFITYFKGVAITANDENTPGAGSIVSYALQNSTYSRLRMYYHNSADTAAFDFTIGSACAHFNQYNHFGHANASAELKAQLGGNTALGKDKLFVQGLGGTKIKLKFPNLKKWASGRKIAINEAQLIMTNSDPSALYTPPVSLSLGVINADSTVSYIVDQLDVLGSSYFDGTYNSTTNTYRFRISRYVQQMLVQATENYGLYLYSPNASLVGNRLILNGTRPELSGHMKLAITYTVVSQ
jgi:hypothetical protein